MTTCFFKMGLENAGSKNNFFISLSPGGEGGGEGEHAISTPTLILPHPGGGRYLFLILLDHPGRYLYGDQSIISDLRRLWGCLPLIGPDTL